MNRLEAVADVGQGPGHDDRHGVVQEGPLHLVLDVDRLDPDQGAATVAVAAVVRLAVARPAVTVGGWLVSLICPGTSHLWRWSG